MIGPAWSVRQSFGAVPFFSEGQTGAKSTATIGDRSAVRLSLTTHWNYTGLVTYTGSLPRSLPVFSTTYTLNPAVSPGVVSAKSVRNSLASPGGTVASVTSSSVV